MRSRLPLIVTLAAWLVATGGDSDIAPTPARPPMLAMNVTEMPAVAASEKTFPPEDRGKSCNSVADAREPQEQSSAGKSVLSGKTPSDLRLITSPTDKLFFPPALLRCGVFAQKDLLASVEWTVPSARGA